MYICCGSECFQYKIWIKQNEDESLKINNDITQYFEVTAIDKYRRATSRYSHG